MFCNKKKKIKKQDVDNTLYIITVIFNPNNFKSRYTLYNDFKSYIEYSGAKLLTVEIAFGDRPFVVTDKDNPWNLQLRTSNELWHKERGINLGFEYLLKIVPNAKYMGWFDADIKFSNPNWVKDSIYALHKYCIIQPFSEAHNLDSNYESMWKCPGILKQYHDIGYHQEPPLDLKFYSSGHPGLAWCARVDTIKKLEGLIDYCASGSGDTFMANAMRGNVELFIKPGMTQEFRDKLKEWEAKCDLYVKRNLGFIHGIVMHYHHGNSNERGYNKRWDIMNFHKFNPNEDIKISNNGLYEWSGNKKNLEYDLRRSMQERNEDMPSH